MAKLKAITQKINCDNHVARIITHLNKHGFVARPYEVKYGKARLSFTRDGKDVATYLSCNFNKSISAWRSVEEEDVVSITVGYNNPQRYPRKKDGTFSYVKIAEKFITQYQTELIKKEELEKQKEQSEQLGLLKKELNLKNKHLSGNHEGYRLSVDILTKEQVKSVVTFMRKEGIDI